MRALHAEIDDLLHGGLLRPVGEDRERIACHRAEGPRPLERCLDGLVAAHESDRMVEVGVLDVAINDGAFPEVTFFLRATAEREDDGQSDFAFAEIISGRFA